jgi:hypothetical protein
MSDPDPKPDWIHICDVCGEEFPDDETFIEHLDVEHDGTGRFS